MNDLSTIREEMMTEARQLAAEAAEEIRRLPSTYGRIHPESAAQVVERHVTQAFTLGVMSDYAERLQSPDTNLTEETHG